jgi:hypothetical protein
MTYDICMIEMRPAGPAVVFEGTCTSMKCNRVYSGVQCTVPRTLNSYESMPTRGAIFQRFLRYVEAGIGKYLPAGFRFRPRYSELAVGYPASQ